VTTKPPEDITSDISLYAIWRESLRVKKPISNRLARAGGLLALIAYAALPWSHTDSLIQTTRQLASIGLPAILGLLGFLLAGYTVFVSIAQKDMLVAMSSVTEKHSGLSWLKVSMYTFVGTLAELLVIACVMLAAVILGQPRGLLSVVVNGACSKIGREIVVCIGFVVCGYAFIHTLVALKITIRNVHHGIAAAIRWNAENP